MEENQIEKKKRLDTVLGIIVAAILSFMVDLYANLYYELFVVNTLKWSQVNHTQVYGMTLVFLALVGFLQFFVEDYQNDIDIRGGLIKRYIKYFFYEFTPGKFIRWFLGAYLLLVLFGFIVGLYYVLAQFGGYAIAATLFAIVLVVLYLNSRKR